MREDFYKPWLNALRIKHSKFDWRTGFQCLVAPYGNDGECIKAFPSPGGNRCMAGLYIKNGDERVVEAYGGSVEDAVTALFERIDYISELRRVEKNQS